MPKLAHLSCFVGFAALLMVNLSAKTAERKKPTHTLRSGRTPGALDQVVVLLEVGGDVKLVEDGKVKRVKMSAVGNLAYDEKSLELPTGSDRCLRSVRYYNKATAVIKVGDGGVKPTLRNDRRLVGVEADGPTVTLFSPEGTLSRTELDLIDVLGNSLLLDRLLPEKPVAIGDSWKVPKDVVTALLGLNAVAKSDVECTLSEVTDTAARVALAGQVEGAIDGVSTEIALKAKYRFDREINRVVWLGLLVKEVRSIGHVGTGVDAVARLQVQIRPQTESPRLADAALKTLSLEPTAELTPLGYDSAANGWQFTHDRCWFVTSDEHDLVVLRMIDRGELVAQCNVASLAKAAADRQPSLKGFQEDVKKALGENFGQFRKAEQWASEQDYRVYRVVVQGEASGLPIHWHYYLIAEERGRQVVFAFTVEEKLIEQFGEADAKLVGTLRFVDPKVALKPKEEPSKAGNTSP